MHKLQCGDICDSHGSDELRGLQCWGILSDYRVFGVVNMCELRGGKLRCNCRINIMHIMQHG